MADEGGAWRDLLSGLVGVASDYVRSGVKISVKTNYTPEISVAAANYDPSRSSGPAKSPSLLGELFGVKAAVIVRNASGQVITTIGDPPPTSPWRAALALVLVGGVVYLVIRGITK